MLQAITIISMLLLVALDQIIKLFVVEYLEPIGTLPLVEGFLQLHYAENTGAAFSSMSGHTDLLSIFTIIIIVIGIILLTTKRIKFGVEYVCTAIMISGGIGNLIDRLYRGFVVDFIEPLFIDFAIFNFADILITCSAVVLCVWMFYDAYRASKKEKEQKNNERSAD